MKKSLSLLLVLALSLPLCPAALAESLGEPPERAVVREYLTFPGDPVYEGESWLRVLSRRREAAQGGLLPREGLDWAQGSVGECYEEGVYRLLCAENYTDDQEARAAFLAAGRAFGAAESGWYDRNRGRDETYYKISVEKYRCYLIYHVEYISDWGRALVPALDALGMTLDDFFNAPNMDRVSSENRDRVEGEVNAYWDFYLGEKLRITVYVDGALLQMDTPVQVKNERTMAPIRALAEALGADVAWDPDTWQVTMKRAGSTVTMTPGETTAWVDGVAVEMDVAPYADRNRTYFPVRYAAQLFGQTVTWNAAGRRVEITESKGAESSDTEVWVLGMGALLGFLEEGDPTRFGYYPRSPHPVTERDETGAPRNRTMEPAAECRKLLAENWEISDREALFEVVEKLLTEGHNQDFQAAANEVRFLSGREVEYRAKSLSGTDKYMWPWTQKLWEKWGKRGIRAWDLCRAAAIAEWGYTAGYLTYPEAMELLAPAVRELQGSFGSWDEVYENFLEGYYWCLRQDLGEDTVWDTDLGKAFDYLKNSPDTRTLFSASMFETGKD